MLEEHLYKWLRPSFLLQLRPAKVRFDISYRKIVSELYKRWEVCIHDKKNKRRSIFKSQNAQDKEALCALGLLPLILKKTDRDA